MEDIKRYRYSDGWDNYGYPCHREDENDSWVYYKDYLATVEKLKADLEVLKNYQWPDPPPGRQSSVLFDDGYVEGWAKAVQTIREDLQGLTND